MLRLWHVTTQAGSGWIEGVGIYIRFVSGPLKVNIHSVIHLLLRHGNNELWGAVDPKSSWLDSHDFSFLPSGLLIPSVGTSHSFRRASFHKYPLFSFTLFCFNVLFHFFCCSLICASVWDNTRAWVGQHSCMSFTFPAWVWQHSCMSGTTLVLSFTFSMAILNGPCCLCSV